MGFITQSYFFVWRRSKKSFPWNTALLAPKATSFLPQLPFLFFFFFNFPLHKYQHRLPDVMKIEKPHKFLLGFLYSVRGATNPVFLQLPLFLPLWVISEDQMRLNRKNGGEDEDARFFCNFLCLSLYLKIRCRNPCYFSHKDRFTVYQHFLLNPFPLITSPRVQTKRVIRRLYM